MKLPKSAYHQDLGRAGDSQRYYKPQRNIHRIINHIVSGEVLAFPPSAVITQQKKIPDVSFWQGLIDWNKMAQMTDTVIIRAGQNVWADSMFLVNYKSAKVRGMRRGIYWFYDDRVSPGDQAKKLLELIGDDLPELPVFADWERKYGGSFGGLSNVVAFMQAVERAVLVEAGLYTGYYFFVENSNAIWNWTQYQYLKDKPLWLAWYASDASAVKVPAPWVALTFWQFGTPAVDWGQASAEIDMSWFNGASDEFDALYFQEGATVETRKVITAAKVWGTIGGTQIDSLSVGTQVTGTPLGAEYFTLVSPRAGVTKKMWLSAPIVIPPPPPPPEPAPVDGYSATFDGTFTFTDAAGKKYSTHIIWDVPLDPM